tara:strand:- start:1556 stop:1777 length:222 start_codon:yes stop_codon:yes gene_type:complete
MVWAVSQDQNAHMKTRFPLNSANAVANVAAVVHCAKNRDEVLYLVKQPVREKKTELLFTSVHLRSAQTLFKTA